MAISPETKEKARKHLEKKRQGLLERLKAARARLDQPVTTDLPQGLGDPGVPSVAAHDAPEYVRPATAEAEAGAPTPEQGVTTVAASAAPAPDQGGRGAPAQTPAAPPPQTTMLLPGSGGSVGALKKGLKKSEGFLKEASKGIEQASEVYQKANTTAASIASDMAQTQAALGLEAADLQQVAASREADKQVDAQQRLDESYRKIQEVKQNVGYRIPAEERQRYQEVLSDPMASPDDKRSAAESLRKAQTFDTGILGNKVFALIVGGILGSRLPGITQVMSLLSSQKIAEQKAGFAANRDAYQRERQAYLDLKNSLGDDKAARLALDEMKLEAVQSRLGSEMSKLKAPQHLANAEKMNAELGLEREKLQAGLAKQLSSQAMSGAVNEARLRENLAASQFEAVKAQGAGAQFKVAGLTQTGESTIDREAFKVVRDVKATGDKVVRAIEEAIRIRKRSGGGFFGTDKRALDRLSEEITTGLAGISGTGVLNEGEYQRFKEQVGDLTSFDVLTNKTLENLEGMRDRFTRAQDSFYQSYGYKRVPTTPEEKSRALKQSGAWEAVR